MYLNHVKYNKKIFYFFLIFLKIMFIYLSKIVLKLLPMNNLSPNFFYC